jgi:transcriptional regulator with XRE-family HTH domain
MSACQIETGINRNSHIPDNPEPTLTFGQLVTIKREKFKLKQVDLARRTGLSQSYVNNLESGVTKKTRKSNYEKLVNFLQITEKELSLVKDLDHLVLNYPATSTVPAYMGKPSIEKLTKSLEEYLDLVISAKGSGTLFDEIKQTTKENVKKAIDLLVEVSLFDKFV